MALTIADSSVVIRDDEQMLADVQAAIRAVLSTGQSYTLFGSRQISRANLTELRQMQTLYERRILAAKGYNGQNHPDFSGSDAGGDHVPTP